MAMVATNPAKAKELGIKQSVGKDFLKADKGRKFATGGEVTGNREDLEVDGGMAVDGGYDTTTMKKGGKVKFCRGGGIESRGQTRGTYI